MVYRFDECGPELCPERIRRLESELGMSLPDEYKTFLLRHNGGRPIPNAFPIEGLANNPFGVIQVFFGVDDPIESCNVDWNYDVHKGRVPSNLLPIATDDGGDLVCLSIFGDDSGAVLFWDRHSEPAEPSYENVYRIAASFAGFIDGIRALG
jgi:hypothetical protein